MRVVIFKRDTKSGISNELGYYDSDSDQWSDDNIPMLINEMFGRSVLPSELPDLLTGGRMWATDTNEFKHLPGRHPQASHGRGGGNISGGPVSKEKRVWQGKRQEVAEGQKLSKLQTGELGERVAMQALSDINGVPFETLNVGINNAPIDVVGDHQAVEVKTGLATNGPGSQRWRATIGEPGREEKASYKALIKQMSPEVKREHNRLKRQAILDRKQSMLDRLTNEAGGERINPLMVGVIMAPDGKKADVFAVDGFHLSLPWRQAATDENYVGTYDIGE